MPTKLSVNLNKVALVRNARGGSRPNLLAAAQVCVGAGAHGLTLHPRPDGRHARAGDVSDLAVWLRDHTPFAELNVEGNPFSNESEIGGYRYPGFVPLIQKTCPTQATLVPDHPGQRTSDHGWDFTGDTPERLSCVIETLQTCGCRVSLFIDPSAQVVEQAADTGADRVELFTGPYADAFAEGKAADILPYYVEAADKAQVAGLGVNAGHDLDLANLSLFLRTVPNVEEVSIGQALIADALHLGLDAAVLSYLSILKDTGHNT